MKVLSTEFWNREQSLICEMIGMADSAERYRVHIRRNAYDFQSHAKAYVWGVSGWQYVMEVPIDSCEVYAFSYVMRGNEWQEHAERDARKIMKRASSLF